MNKIDVPHLKGDIVKYYEAGVLTSMTYLWWQGFLNTFKLAYCSLPEENPVCLLDT